MKPLDKLSKYDLVTPDGAITNFQLIDEKQAEAIVFIENISPEFVGFDIEPEYVFFNIKSTLAQVGVDGCGQEYELDRKNRCAQVRLLLKGIGKIGREMLKLLQAGATIGKLFAADQRRRVRDPFYLSRMFGRSDRWGRPLLSLGGLHGSTDLILDKVEGRTIAYLTLQNGRLDYEDSIDGFLPTLAKALLADLPMREIVGLHLKWRSMVPHNIGEDRILLVRTLPLHIRTVFARVAAELLSEGYQHTSACILQPDTHASGDIYELFGKSVRELTDIPLEFYTLEPYREHVFFEDRDQLQTSLEDPNALFTAFETAPLPIDQNVAVYIAKGEQLLNLKKKDWVARAPKRHDFPGPTHGERQGLMVERYIEQQATYPFLKGIDDGNISSQGILLCRYFPTPLMKRMLLSNQVQRYLKGIYFQFPSLSYNGFFSSEDRALLHDLNKFAIPVFWVDQLTQSILQFIQKPDRDSGMFVPINQVDTFLKATIFGIYGSNLLAQKFDRELRTLFQSLLELRNSTNHLLMNKQTPLALLTGGGPGAMEVGNRVAKELNILSCANIVDFRQPESEMVMYEQRQNPYIEAKMTYRLDKLVERQAEFNLDFPIFVMGGIGTDFELCLEEVRRKVGAVPLTPVLLMGEKSYWKSKLTERFRCNVKSGTIKGSEWLSNCFYCAKNAEQALKVYEAYFNGNLPIGIDGPVYDEGFAS
ncbi:MAG: hypothetical protein WB791_04500 [Waddliaceae bacterium]